MAEKSSTITLFGATGYTGKRIAQALDQASLPYRIAGRSAEKLALLSQSLTQHPVWLTADAAQPATLAPLYQNTSLLINCAGPFTDLGERVIAQAAMSGVDYLDITNELGFVFRARGYHEMAARTGARLVPACGFEVALADCLAQWLCDTLTGPEPLDGINVVYALSGKGSSIGTRRSAIRSLATSWITYRNGEWRGQIPGGSVQKFNLPGGPRYALSFPSSESVTLPQHIQTRRVDTWMATTAAARFYAPLLIPSFARLSRSIFRGLILSAAAHSGGSGLGTLDVGLREEAPFSIYVQAQRGSQSWWAALTGQDPYGLTAQLVTYYARQMTANKDGKKGLLAPAMAVDSHAFIAYTQSEWGVNLMSGEG